MKNNCLTFLILMLIGLGKMNAQCIPVFIHFTTQGQIDSFPINYPGCTHILGNVRIQEAIPETITNLESLSNIDSIGGSLFIHNNTGLPNLHGLQSLKYIGGTFEIGNNDLLENFDGLQNLAYIETGLTVGSWFGSSNVASPITLLGLDGLAKINGFLQIFDNDRLENLDGLENLTTVKVLRIADNPMLQSLNGIKNINADSLDLGDFSYIANCSNLSVCNVTSICNMIADTIVHIDSNSDGCNDFYEVAEACMSVGLDYPENEAISVYPIPSSDRVYISEIIDGHLRIVDNCGKVQQEMKLSGNEIDISKLSTGIYYLQIISDDFWMTEKIIKK